MSCLLVVGGGREDWHDRDGVVVIVRWWPKAPVAGGAGLGVIGSYGWFVGVIYETACAAKTKPVDIGERDGKIARLGRVSEDLKRELAVYGSSSQARQTLVTCILSLPFYAPCAAL